jgi:predicted TIM-barrel fold metal-dependent hydrolase
MAKSGRRKTTPEQRAEWKRNEDRLAELLERRLERDGLTREEVERRAYESLRKSLSD